MIRFHRTQTGRSFSWPVTVVAVWVLMALVGLTGCTTVPRENVSAFATGVGQVNHQSSLAWASINELAREDLIDWAAAQPTLNDQLFVEVLPPEAVIAWERALSGLEQYALHLVTLTAPSLTAEARAQALALAEQVKATGAALEAEPIGLSVPGVDAPLATGFVKLGEILIRARAEGQAAAILRETDPAVQQIMGTMAEVIGSTRREGLRLTSWSHWDQRKAEVMVAFLRIDGEKDKQAAQKRRVVAEYLRLRDRQRADDAALASLARSLRALGVAHRALANGQSIDLLHVVNLIQMEIEDTRVLYQRLQTLGEPTS